MYFEISDKIFQMWENMTLTQGNDVRAVLNIETDVSENVQLSVRGYLERPALGQELVDFGLSKIHHRTEKNITVHNPSDLPMFIQFFLGPEDAFTPQAIDSLILKQLKQLGDKIGTTCILTETYDSLIAPELQQKSDLFGSFFESK